MRYLATYLLQIGIGGKTSPSAADIKKLIGTVGIETDDECLDKLISELKGKSIDELIAEGSSKLASVSS
ncbi:dimerization domain of ribosomal protein P1P2, partial [Mycena albidolilacea]